MAALTNVAELLYHEICPNSMSSSMPEVEPMFKEVVPGGKVNCCVLCFVWDHHHGQVYGTHQHGGIARDL